MALIGITGIFRGAGDTLQPSVMKLIEPVKSYFFLPSPFGVPAVISAYTKGEG